MTWSIENKYGEHIPRGIARGTAGVTSRGSKVSEDGVRRIELRKGGSFRRGAV